MSFQSSLVGKEPWNMLMVYGVGMGTLRDTLVSIGLERMMAPSELDLLLEL